MADSRMLLCGAISTVLPAILLDFLLEHAERSLDTEARGR